MARYMVKQPDGKYAIFSTICDDYVLIDATSEEVIEALIEEFRERTVKEINNSAAILENYEENYPKRYKMDFAPCYPVGSWEKTQEIITDRLQMESCDDEE